MKHEFFKGNWIRGLVLFTIRHYKGVLSAAAVLSVCSVFILTGIETNFSLRAFDAQPTTTYRKSQEYLGHFNEPETEILLIILEFPHGLNCRNLDRVLAFCRAVKETEGHFGLLSLAEMPINYDINEEESEIAPFRQLYREYGCEFALREMAESPIADRFFNRQSSRLYLYLRVLFRTGYEPGHRALREKINHLAKIHTGIPVTFAGFPSLVFTLKEIFYKESLYFIIAYVLLFAFLFHLHFRDIRLILFSILIIGQSTLWTLACLVPAGLQLNFLGGLTFLLIYLSCTSDIFHLLQKYRDQGTGTEKTTRIYTAAVETAPKSFLTSLSTAVGFGILCFSGVPGLVNFGAYTAIGMMLAFLVTLLLAPPLMKIFTGKTGQLRDGRLVPAVEKTAERILTIIQKFPRRIIFISGLLALAVVLALYHTNRLGAATFLDIRPHHAEARLFTDIENELGGMMPFYIYFHAPEAAPPAHDTIIKTFFNLERELAAKYPYAAVDGLYTQLQMLAEEDLDFEEFETLASGMITSEPERIRLFYNSKTGYCRIILRVKNVDIKRFIKDKEAFLGLFPYTSGFKWYVYSEAFKIHESNLVLVDKFQSSILLGLIFFSAILGLILRSWFVFFATAFINLLPLMLVYAIAVFAGIPAHVMVVAGFCVALGIVLDDSIYVMMDGYGKLRNKQAAFNDLYMRLFPPLAATTLLILSGAGIIAFSAFIGIHYFGIILLLSIAGGFIFDIFTGMALVRLRFKK